MSEGIVRKKRINWGIWFPGLMLKTVIKFFYNAINILCALIWEFIETLPYVQYII
jgi:hypothetical protein